MTGGRYFQIEQKIVSVKTVGIAKFVQKIFFEVFY